MTKATILVVEDDASMAGLLRSVLEAEQYGVSIAESVLQARSLLRKCRPDLVILDRNLPDRDGIELCRELRAQPEHDSLAVLFLSARGSVAQKTLGLRLGGDDYLAKPFDLEELVARVEVLLRRTRACAREPGSVTQGPLHINVQSRIARMGMTELELTAKEFDLLRTFLERPQRVLSRTFLLAHIWGYGLELELSTKAVDMMVLGLRRKLGRYGEWIETVKGFGYRFRQS